MTLDKEKLPVKVIDMKKYYCVRKVAYDQMWHALYVVSSTRHGLRKTYDRVTKKEALEISENLCPEAEISAKMLS